MVIFPLLLLLLSSCSSAPSASCPPTPSSCQCEPQSSGRLSVFCNGVSLPQLFKDLGALPLDLLKVTNCSQAVLDVAPLGQIRSLEISNCGIKSIDGKFFKSFAASLEELVLSNNSLTTIPLFGSLPNLVSLNLNGNQLNDVAEKSLEGLHKLRQLRLEGNKICSLSPNALSEAKASLELLDMSGNCFTAMPAQNLRNSARLMYLDLSDNKIGEINNFELMNLPVLKEVRLNNNELRTMHPMAFMNVPRLQFLYLKDNLLAALDGNKLQALQQLEVLDVTNNLLPKVPILKDFPNLLQVRLDGNLIEKIDTLTFSNNPRLMLISLQNNNIVQIARNSFDLLDQMQVLLLANNSLPSLERGMLDGMRNLVQLTLRNNSLSKVDPNAFQSVPLLTTLDLAYNRLEQLNQNTFAHLSKLFWLDLSNNKLQGFEKDTFNKKIANILLDGNMWNCDESFDWFVAFLVANQVRTFLPFQKEISCSEPNKTEGVRLKDLMMKKANETILETRHRADENKRSLAMIPGLGNFQLGGLGGLAAPFMQQRNAQPQQPSPGFQPPVNQRSPSSPASTDIRQLMQNLPSFVVNIPGMGAVDISKLDPGMIDYVLKGGQIPGIPKETLDGIVQQYIQKIRAAAAAQGRHNKVPQQIEILPQQAVSTLPKEDAPTVPQQKVKIEPKGAPTLNPAMMEMWKLLPPGYNISKIPAEVLSALTTGHMPDLSKLPSDLLEHFKANSDKMATVFSRMAPSNTSIEEVLSKLPKFEKPLLATFSPYDINKLSSEMIHEEELKAKAAKMRVYTGIVLGLVGAVTIVVLAIFVIYLRKQRLLRSRVSPPSTEGRGMLPNPLHSTYLPPSFHH